MASARREKPSGKRWRNEAAENITQRTARTPCPGEPAITRSVPTVASRKWLAELVVNVIAEGVGMAVAAGSACLGRGGGDKLRAGDLKPKKPAISAKSQ